MFGKHLSRRRHGVSHRVQNWVDEGMEMVRDRAKQPAMWGAALSVAACALMGYTAYKNRGETGKVLPARAQKALRRAMGAGRQVAGRARKKGTA